MYIIFTRYTDSSSQLILYLLGIQIAALSYMAPSRKGDISSVAFRAFIAGR